MIFCLRARSCGQLLGGREKIIAMARSGAVLLVFLLFAALAAGAPATDSSLCISCHRAQAGEQPHTSMARALSRVGESEILRSNPKLTFREGDYSYQIANDGAAITYTVTDGNETLRVPLQWSFGLGTAGQTYVYQRRGQWYETRLSYYQAIRGLDLTPGHKPALPRSLEDAAGRFLDASETPRCFGCHATNAVVEGRLSLAGITPGVQCERCHGPAAKHVEAMKTGDLKAAAMPKLGKLPAEDLSNFCGQCHRTWAEVAMNGPHDINNVRFQPYGLTNSRCYDPADPRIRCVACHDPHREVVKSAAAYDPKCLACHGGSDANSPAKAKPCPSANKNCVTCHMPKYELPGAHKLFTHHQIRIAKPGEPYPN